MSSPTFLDYYRSAHGQRLLLRQGAALAAVAVALLVLFGASDLDRIVSRWFFDGTQRTFPLVDHWLFKTVLHDAARTVSAVAALAFVGLTAYSWLAGPGRLKDGRQELAFMSVAALTAAALVGALKHFSTHACPWDLTDFGGLVTYRPLVTAPTSLHAVAGCLPAAHPLSGYAWLCIGFALYPAARTGARRAWGWAFALGTLLGLVQVVRGAHFLSHVLWSAWVVWSVNLAILGICRAMTARVRLTYPRRHAVPR
jgi:membrane-associated PAP2 superfamily phosphatase